jgi:hypothetical protein
MADVLIAGCEREITASVLAAALLDLLGMRFKLKVLRLCNGNYLAGFGTPVPLL